MRHVWTVLCRTLLEDQNSNNPSLIEATERIAFKAEVGDERPLDLPFPTPLVLVTNWWSDGKEDRRKYLAKVRFISPEEDELLSFEHEVDLERGEKMRVNGQIGSLPYTVNGIYEFEISYLKDEEWTPVTSIPLEIIRQEPDSEGSESAS